MDDLRSSTPDERRGLKAAVRRAIKLAGNAASVSHVTRVKESDLSRYAGNEYADRHCPIDVALDLDREADSPVIVAALASYLGYRLVADATAMPGGVSLADIGRIVAENSDVVRAVTAATPSGCGAFSEADRRQINQEIEEACSALRSLQRRVNGAGSEGGQG